MYKTCTVYSGGLIGYTDTDYGTSSGPYSGMVKITGCSANGTVTASSKASAYSGGMIGYAQVFTEEEYGVEVTNSEFNGTVNSYYGDDEACTIAHVGGVMGYNNSRCLLENVKVEGNMYVNSTWSIYMGCLIGESSAKVDIYDCIVTNMKKSYKTQATDSWKYIGDLIGSDN